MVINEIDKFVNTSIIPVEDIRTMLVFKGACNSKLELPINASTGDIYAVGDDTYLYDGNNWNDIGNVINGQPKESPQKIVPRICSQCGAPVKSSRLTCDYCGVKYV